MNQERIKSRQFPPELVHPGVPARDLMLFQARRGDFGPVASEADVERKIDAAFARMTTPGGTRYVRREDGRTSNSASSRSATAASSRCSATSPS